MFLLVGLVGFAFLQASATAKVVNTATNLGALVFFVPAGVVLLGLGAVLAVANLTGRGGRCPDWPSSAVRRSSGECSCWWWRCWW